MQAECLDESRWDDWLDLYAEDACFWMPAWKNETETTTDPDTELSLIYYKGRNNLADRVWRVRSGQSVASTPRIRAVHLITNVRLVRPTKRARKSRRISRSICSTSDQAGRIPFSGTTGTSCGAKAIAG
jgi:3-phenylpropionate/cinnamic acid dioxygenase small subunit